MQNSSPPPLHPMPTSNSTADDSGFNINLNSFTLVMLMGVLMYSLMLSLVHRKLSILHARSNDLNIIKLFVMSCWFAVLIRLLSFVGLGALSIANINVNYKFTGEFHSASARLARSNPPVTPPPLGAVDDTTPTAPTDDTADDDSDDAPTSDKNQDFYDKVSERNEHTSR